MVERVYLDWDAMYNDQGGYPMLKTVDWTETKTDSSIWRVKLVAAKITHLTYNAKKHGIRYCCQFLYKLDQCEFLRKFLAICGKLETLVVCNLPGREMKVKSVF